MSLELLPVSQKAERRDRSETPPPRKRARAAAEDELFRTSSKRVTDLEQYNLARQSGLLCTLPPFTQAYLLASHRSDRDLAKAYDKTLAMGGSATVISLLRGVTRLSREYDECNKGDVQDMYNLQHYDRTIRRAFCLAFLLGFAVGSQVELESFRRNDFNLFEVSMARDKNEWYERDHHDFFYCNIRVFSDEGDETEMTEESGEMLHPAVNYMERLWFLHGCPDLTPIWSRATTAIELYESFELPDIS